MLKAFLKSGLLYTIPTVLSRGLSVVLVPLYTRVLSPADYGALDILIAFGNLVALTVALEVSQGVARYLADQNDNAQKRTLVSTALWFSVATYSVFFVVAQIAAEPIAKALLGTSELTPTFRLSVLQISIHGLALFCHNQLRWQLRPRAYAIGSVLLATVGGLVSVVLAYGYRLGVTGMIVGLLSGSSVTLAFSLFALRDTLQRHFDRLMLRKMLLFSVPLVPSSIAVFFAKFLDRFMIRHFLALESVGVYGIAFRLSSVLALIMVGFRSALTPLVYAHHQEPTTPFAIATIFQIFVSIMVVLYLSISLFSREILQTFTDAQYWDAAKIVPFLSLAVLFSSMYIFAPGLFLEKRTGFVLAINAFGAVINGLFNFFLIPRMGSVGAASATLLSNAVVFLLFLTSSQSLYPIPHNWRFLIPVSAFGVGAAFYGGVVNQPLFDDVFPKFALIAFTTCSVFLLNIFMWTKKRSETRSRSM